MAHDIVILGVFVADTAYRADRQPKMGETILGHSFVLGPGGKGSNQSVAAARAGGDVAFLSKLGDDDFADMAMATWAGAGVTPKVTRDPSSYTGAAYIFIEEATGNNAIIISPGAAATISGSRSTSTTGAGSSLLIRPAPLGASSHGPGGTCAFRSSRRSAARSRASVAAPLPVRNLRSR